MNFPPDPARRMHPAHGWASYRISATPAPPSLIGNRNEKTKSTTMAYLFHDPLAADLAEPCAQLRVDAALSPIEARVVELALADGPATLATARWQRTLAAMLGQRPAKPLASPRLEALRRFVVLIRHAPAAAAEEVAKLLGLGFSAEQLCAVRQRVGTAA